MLVKGIDLPDSLLLAQATGELVVFAGAGVSMPPPSSLPSFDMLAEMIGSGSGLKRSANEPADRYLGRLKQKEINVHDASARILVNENTKPHDLHRLILELFPSFQKIRIVTTNFDTHFSVAAKNAFGDSPETFCAPALPLGDDFNGLVYLHGCAGKESKRCVLTDEDFGRAYLTQSWASRFLAAMFSRYVVLFIGYSHNDIVMNYLARGLPPVAQKSRFAFTTDDADSLSQWNFLGIKPLIYKKCEGENHHKAITDTTNEWVKEIRRGLLEKAERIRIIAESQPPLEGEDSDYIKHSLSELDTARIFFKHAKSSEWIHWLDKGGFVQPLFKPHTELGDFHWALSGWLVENFLIENPQALLAAIERHGGQLHSRFCWWVWRRLASRNQKPISEKVFSQWVMLLLTQSHDILAHQDWAALLNECRFPNDKAISVLLFDQVTKPRIVLKKSWRMLDENHAEQDEIDFELNHERQIEEHWVREAWRNLFSPHLQEYADDLEQVVFSNLRAAHTLKSFSYPPNRNLDVFIFHRQSIHPNSQDRFQNVVDVLIDAARDILNLSIQAKPQYAAGQIEKLFASDVPILRRLAIYGHTKRNDILPDEKIQWVVQNNLLFNFKTDVFWLLENNYSKASDEMRKQLLDKAMLGPDWEGCENVDEKTKKYEVFNLVVWLSRIAPTCIITRERLALLKKRNPEFGEREFPEFSHWSSGGESLDDAAGLNAADFLLRTTADVLEELLASQPRTPFERNRSGYCGTISSAVSKKPEWGIEWLQTLISRKLMDKDLWYCVCQGWRNANLSPEQWKLVLDVAESIDAPSEFFSAFAEILENGSRRESHSLPENLMEQAQRVAMRIWNLVLKDEPIVKESSDDWLGVAINRPGGKLAEFWLQRVSLARKIAGEESWHGLPKEIKDPITDMLHGLSQAAVHARIVFASQFHYFFSLDAQFAIVELLPLFDWQSDQMRAEQCWHGFIFWGRWLTSFSEQLLPYFTETIDRIGQFSDRVREGLIYQIAGVILFRIENPLAQDWLPNVLQKIQDDDRVKLAATIDRYLSEIQVPIAEKLWERWIEVYWNMRLLGSPKPLLAKEANEMACWALSVGRYFPAAIKLAISMKSVLTFESTPAFYLIDKKTGLASNYPDAVADLVLLYLGAPLNYFYHDEHVNNVWADLCQGGVSSEKLMKIRDEVFRRGGQDLGKP